MDEDINKKNIDDNLNSDKIEKQVDTVKATVKEETKLKKFCTRYFIDAFSGMALGLFCTLIIGTIISQIGGIIGDNSVGRVLVFVYIGTCAKMVMGAGIGFGIATNLKSKKIACFATAAAGMIGANISNIFSLAGVQIWGVNMATASIGIGDPVSAYIASVLACEIASKVEGKTKVDIILVPLSGIFAGVIGAITVGIPFNMLFTLLGKLISLATEIEPISMGIIVAVSMGLLLTFPTSSAAFGIMLFGNTSGLGASLAAGASVAGCSAHMVGFATASYRENKIGGVISQGLGTSMIQISNIAKNWRILMPAIISSAIAGPLSSAVFGLGADATGSGMGTAGLVGIFSLFNVSIVQNGMHWAMATFGILTCNFIVPIAVSLFVSEFMRKKEWIKFGDMKI